MKILLFDDDKSTVDMLLQTIPWQSLCIDAFAPVYSVEQAKAAFKADPAIDLMICDIEAPGGTGIDLLRWVREQGYPTENIFLTNHENFSFVSEAMKLDSVEYILKMSPTEDIVAALRRAIARVQRREMLHAYTDESLRRQGEQFWAELLHREALTPQTVSAEAASHGIVLQSQYIPALCAALGLPKNGAEPALRAAFESSCNEEHDPELVQLYLPESTALLLLFPDAAKPEHVLQQMVTQLQKQFPSGRCNCYLGHAAHPAEIPQAVRQLETEARGDILHNGALIPCAAHAPVSGAQVESLPVEEWKSLLRQYEKGELFSHIQAYVNHLCREGVTRDVLWQFHHDYLQLLFAVLAEDHIEAHLLFHEMAVIRLCDSAPDSAFNTMKWVDYSLTCAIKAMKEARNTPTLIEQVRNYIDQHFCEKLTRGDIAAQFYLSADYLSHAFGKAYEMSLPEYINTKRLEYACELLLRGSSITDAAMEAGFESVSYFSTLFKRQKGMTPGDYRRK